MLGWLGVPMIVRPADIDEVAHPREAPAAYLERIIRAKLDAIRARGTGEAGGILVADTIVVAPDGEIVGKPSGEEEACAFLERLAGATHEVTTRFGLADPGVGSDWRHAESVTTHVTFREIPRDEVSAYVATGEGSDKAGGYALQGRAGAFVERIEGSFTSVVGLPLCEVVVAMRAAGWL
jgi:septum formation protein